VKDGGAKASAGHCKTDTPRLAANGDAHRLDPPGRISNRSAALCQAEKSADRAPRQRRTDRLARRVRNPPIAARDGFALPFQIEFISIG